MARVLIVGGGPAGASLAYLLAHRGIEVTLLERQRDLAREFRGEVLIPTGLEAFEQMGLAEALSTVPSFAQESLAAYMNGRLLESAKVDPEFFRGRPPTAVSQPALLEMLMGEAARSPHFRLLRGASAKDLVSEDGRVVGVRARTEDGDQELRADLVVGADGRASVVRRRGGLRVSRSDPPMDVVWCKLPCPEDWRGVRAFLGRGHLLVSYRTWDGSLQLGWVILKGTFGELRSRGIEEWIEEMANHVSPDLAAHLRAHGQAVQKPFLLDTVSDCVESWSIPGALVIGDAAHTMSPVAAQGINIALRDAIVAANHLVPILAESTWDPAHLDAALRAIETERMREVAPIQELQALPPKVVLNRAWWGEPLRRILAALLKRRLPQRLLIRRVDVFNFGVTEVQLKV
jgi:2-polyprenyl-6-methoxyphenol hydroxylase-like FAD-dependent oxidoreductase